MPYVLAQMPGKNPRGLFPQLLSRKSYFIRWMLCFVITVGIFVLCAGEIFPKWVAQAWFVVAGLYSLFGLHIPRLKDAGLSLWLLLLFIIPIAGVVLQIIMFVKPSKATQPPPPASAISESPVA